MKMKKLIVPAVVAVVVIGAAGGGYLAFGRTTDPAKKAQELIAKGDLRGAQIELRNAVRASPDNPVAHMRLGQIQMQMGDPVAGEKELKTARDLGGDRWGDPADPGRRVHAAVALQGHSDGDSAGGGRSPRSPRGT